MKLAWFNKINSFFLNIDLATNFLYRKLMILYNRYKNNNNFFNEVTLNTLLQCATMEK